MTMQNYIVQPFLIKDQFRRSEFRKCKGNKWVFMPLPKHSSHLKAIYKNKVSY